MKKIFLLLLAFCLVLCGCEKNGKNDADDRISYVYSDVEDDNNGDDKEYKKTKAYIDDSMFEALGKTIKQVEGMFGEISESIWVDGPLYKFGASDLWFAFSEYDFAEDNTYIPLGKCVMLTMDVDDFVETSGAEINDGILASLSDSGISKGYEEMDGMVYYEITHGIYKITIYEDHNGDISGDSGAYVRLLEE